LTYNNIHEGIFRSRPNRFIAHVEIDGRIEPCHVKNTGRCKGLLVPGTKVYLNQSDNPNRTTKYDLVTVHKGDILINMDSQAPNRVFNEYLQTGKYLNNITFIKPELKYGNSRFDFYVETTERKIFIEVKGVTLEYDGVAMFPDAPTERGVKHLNALVKSIQDGYEAHVVFIIKMQGINYFTPNYEIHQAFGEALVNAHNAGVKINALGCNVTPSSLTIVYSVPIKLDA